MHCASVWGNEGEERLCVMNQPTPGLVRVFDIASGKVLYTVDEPHRTAQALPGLGALLFTPLPKYVFVGCMCLSLLRCLHREGCTLTPRRSKADVDCVLYAQHSGSLLVRTRQVLPQLRHSNVILVERQDGALLYWSPFDPNRVNRLECSDWTLQATHDRLMLFVRRTECLLWLWGAATAVRATFSSERGPPKVWLCNGAGFVQAYAAMTVLMLPMPPSSVWEATPLPTLLPHASAALNGATEFPCDHSIDCGQRTDQTRTRR